MTLGGFAQHAFRCVVRIALPMLLAACTSLPPVMRAGVNVAADEPFAIEGRLSARHGADAVTANFSWRHHAPQDELRLTTPLGQQMAELHGDARLKRVDVRTADGRTDEAEDWATLTERALGFRLPIDGLSAWVRGAATAGVPSTFERDASGRASVLRQQGWEIVYSYPDDTTRRPSRLRLAYPELEVRIVIDRWQD